MKLSQQYLHGNYTNMWKKINKTIRCDRSLRNLQTTIGPKDLVQNCVAYNYMHMHTPAVMQRTQRSGDLKHSAAASFNVAFDSN
jgi:hypothetical protein